MALQRVAGDDWKWHWVTEDEVSSWSDVIVQMRVDHDKESALIASNVAVDGWVDENDDPREPNLFTDGSDDLDLPPTDFDAGVFTIYVLGDTTAGISRTPYIEVEAIVAGSRRTVMPARPIRFRQQLAVRPA
jgi:hypothetical protein